MKKNKISLGNVSAGAWARLALLAAALVNTALTILGKSPLTASGEAGETAGIILTAGAALLSYWKNNSFTLAAQAADEVMNELKKR